MCMNICLHVCMRILSMPGTLRSQKRVGSQKLESKTVGNHHVVQTGSSSRAAGALDCLNHLFSPAYC